MDSGENQEPNYPTDANSYTIIEVIGRGTNTIIYRAFCNPMKTNVVIKSIKFDKSNNSLTISYLDSTISATPVLNHPNILNSHCTFLTADNLVWVVMPLMSAGSLQSIMSCFFPAGLPEEYIAIFLKPIFNLLSYLQQMEAPDIELKAGNILLDHDGTFKFSDFGLWLSSQRMENITGKSYWVAPELIESSDAYSVKSDIWSFGILALELAHGKPPLYDFPLSKSLIKKMKQRFSYWKFDENNYEKTFSETFKNLVKSCLKRNPAKRPTLNMLQNHPFFENCKSTDYLVDKMLKNLPPIVNRFEFFTEIRGEEKDDDDDNEEELNVISGWKLNVDILKLFPFCSNEIQVEEEDEYWDYAKLEAVNAELHKVIKQLNVVCWTSSRTDYLETLFTVKKRLEEQLNRIISLFNSRGGVLFEVPFYEPSLDEQNGKEDNA